MQQMPHELKAIRSALRLSQEQLGYLLGLTRNRVCRCEAGAPVPTRAVVWVSWLACTLVTFDEDQIRGARVLLLEVQRGTVTIPDWWGYMWAIRTNSGSI